MGFFDKMNDKADAKTLDYVKSILLPGEEVKEFMRTVNDFVAITNQRFILCDHDFDWGDTKNAIFSVPKSKVTATSIVNPLFGLVKKYKVGVHVGSLTVKLTFYKEEDAKKCWMLINSIII